MELGIQQADLAFGVARALGSVSNKSPLPLLSCILLEADKSGLRITGTDLDVTTSALVPCTVKTPAHRARLSHGVVIIEALNLAEVEPGMYEMYCLPLRVVGGDGAPARVTSNGG